MLREITMREALETFANGEDVKILVPSVDDGWSGYTPYMLRDLLGVVIFFADYDVIDVTDEPDPEPEEIEPEEPPKTSAKKDLDVIKSLRNAGWSMAKIAEEMGVSPQTICNRLKGME